MKASKKLDNDDSLFQELVNASLQDGPQEYTAVTNGEGKLMAWGLLHASNRGEWIWVHKNYRK